MRIVRALLALALLLALHASNVQADSDLTSAVASAYFPRVETPEMHALAHQRAAEVAVVFSHDGMLTTEVLAWNQNAPDPIGTVIVQWQGSPGHDAILSDPKYDLIGCGSVVTPDGRYVAACVLATSSASDVQVAPEPPFAPAPQVANPTAEPVASVTPPPVVVMPDTATEAP